MAKRSEIILILFILTQALGYEVIVDNTSGGFTKSENVWFLSTQGSGYYKSDFLWCKEPGGVAIWKPNLKFEGKYEIFFRGFYFEPPEGLTQTGIFKISTLRESKEIKVDFEDFSRRGTWQKLGEVENRLPPRILVSLRPAGENNLVTADALKFVYTSSVEGKIIFEDEFISPGNWSIERVNFANTGEIKEGKLILTTKRDAQSGLFYWFNQNLPSSFRLEFEFKPVISEGIFSVFFCVSGEEGEDIFNSKYWLNKTSPLRDFDKYARGELLSYACQFKRDHYPNCNLKKQPGNYYLSRVTVSMIKDKEVHQIVLSKVGSLIELYVNGKLFISCQDKGVDIEGESIPGRVLGKGKFGFRQVGETKAEYDNFKIISLETSQRIVFTLPDFSETGIRKRFFLNPQTSLFFPEANIYNILGQLVKTQHPPTGVYFLIWSKSSLPKAGWRCLILK